MTKPQICHQHYVGHVGSHVCDKFHERWLKCGHVVTNNNKKTLTPPEELPKMVKSQIPSMHRAGDVNRHLCGKPYEHWQKYGQVTGKEFYLVKVGHYRIVEVVLITDVVCTLYGSGVMWR